MRVFFMLHADLMLFGLGVPVCVKFDRLFVRVRVGKNGGTTAVSRAKRRDGRERSRTLFSFTRLSLLPSHLPSAHHGLPPHHSTSRSLLNV